MKRLMGWVESAAGEIFLTLRISTIDYFARFPPPCCPEEQNKEGRVPKNSVILSNFRMLRFITVLTVYVIVTSHSAVTLMYLGPARRRRNFLGFHAPCERFSKGNQRFEGIIAHIFRLRLSILK